MQAQRYNPSVKSPIRDTHSQPNTANTNKPIKRVPRKTRRGKVIS